MPRDTLGSLEYMVLSTLSSPPSEPYGLALRDKLKDQGKDISIGALYTCLDRLEKKGFVSSSWGASTPERGGRKKRLFKIEASGRQARISHEQAHAPFFGQLAAQV